MLLKFSPMKNNTKLKKIGNWADHYVGYTFSLPSGYSCPGASECLSKADKDTGKITDGKDMFIDVLVPLLNQYTKMLGIKGGITLIYYVH